MDTSEKKRTGEHLKKVDEDKKEGDEKTDKDLHDGKVDDDLREEYDDDEDDDDDEFILIVRIRNRSGILILWKGISQESLE